MRAVMEAEAQPDVARALTVQAPAAPVVSRRSLLRCAACATARPVAGFDRELDALREAALARRTLARACSPAADCATPNSSLTQFVQETENKPENKSKDAKRKANCAAKKPECTSDGHAAPAYALIDFLKDRSPARLGFVSGIFVNKDMPADYGAVTVGCTSFTPPLPANGGNQYCVTVPDVMEAEAKLYKDPKNKIIGGVPRYTWVTRTLMTLTHETEHGRFDSAADDSSKTPLKGPSTGSCTPSDVASDLSEMAAQMSEFPILLRRLQIFPSADQDKKLAEWFDYHLSNGSEDVTGTLKSLRCRCECNEVDAYIKQVVAFAQASWNTWERFAYHSEMKKPVHKLNWPVDPPSVDVNDLPSTTPAVDAKDLGDVASLGLKKP